MDSKNANLEERLKSLLVQLASESGILERIIHKNKNQHRRSPYFQALLKVRRDLRLLQSAGLDQILNAFALIIKGISPAEHAHQSKHNQKKHPRGKHTYQNRLLGVARLLSQMVEPILKAAIQISLLLAKSFFMGFSLIILACLARLRVLVQQALIDVVSVFNMLATHSQKHSLKLSSEGTEACVKYCSTSCDILTLECIWEEDKYVLRESSHCRSGKIPEEQGAFSLESPIKYQTLERLGQGLDIRQENIPLEESPCNESQPRMISSSDQSAASDRSIKSTECEKSPNADPACGPIATAQASQTDSRKRVAFVAVEISKASESEPTRLAKMTRLNFSTGKNSDDGTFPDFSFTGSENKTLF